MPWAAFCRTTLYGLDIDDRAAQLAYFAVMMKARRYDRRFFSHTTQPHVYAIEESNRIEKPDVEYFCNGKPSLTDAMHTILTQLHDAKEYGSILTITPQDWNALYARFDEVADESSFHRESIRKNLLPLVQVAQTLAQKYDVVVTNPPYMGASNMNPKLNEFIKQNYTDYKSDFFSAFIVKCSSMAKPEGYCGLFTPYVWMFIQSYEKLRQYLYQQATLETLIQFEYSAFEEATVPVCTFTFSNRYVNKKGCYLRLVDFRGGMEVQRQKMLEAMTNHDCGFYYEQSTDNFAKIPGSPVAYWTSEKILLAYENGTLLNDCSDVKIGMGTAKNEIFVREWWEVFHNKIDFSLNSINDLEKSSGKYFPYNKGGEFRLWYGNLQEVLWFDAKGRQYMNTMSGHRENGAHDFYCKEGLTWSFISSSKFGVRYLPTGCFFDVAGSTLFSKKDNLYTLGFLSSCVCFEILGILNPTLNYQAGNIKSLPLLIDKVENVDNLVEENIRTSKTDWDSFETSWDFTRHPFIKAITKYPNMMDIGNIYLAECYDIWAGECEERFEKLKANEEELNRIFIDIYGLQDELTPEVEDKDVTVRKADLCRDVRSFISYAVGCMFGRYSPTFDGLAYAGGTWDDSKYNIYKPDADGIIPICDDEYFEDDMVGRFVEFVRVVYGDSSLEDNLRFIANALGGKGQPKEVIRNYFLNDFYADHCKIYQKRPIYWLFDSGKKNGFKCLIYLHRYQPDTIARIRTDYVHEQQARYRTAIEGLEKQVAAATSTSERVKLTKQLNKVQAQDTELHQYEEKVHALADQMIKIDLDDGVKHNYEIFKDVLAKIK